MLCVKQFSVVLLLLNIKSALLLNATCKIDFECEECLPENMPMVTSHRVTNSILQVPSGDEVTFFCHKAKFFSYPLKNSITAYCEDDRYRVLEDTSLRHLIELGCQENLFEDVLHHVDYCDSPRQGRSYQFHNAVTGATRHLANLCYDQDTAITIFAKMTTATENNIQMARHSDQESPLSLLGNFNQMFDIKTRGEAEKLFADDRRMNKRIQELLKHNHFNFAGQTLSSAKLLSSLYFDDQNMRVTDFISNRVAMWKSVATGNMHNVHLDIKHLIKNSKPNNHVDIYVGTYGILSMRSGSANIDIYMKPGKRFPVAKYIWNVIHDKKNNKAVAIVTLNNPYIAVSEIRESVFCTSACSKIPWLHELKRNQNYETPVYGLVFCCNIHDFKQTVLGMPRNIPIDVPYGDGGLMINIPGY